MRTIPSMPINLDMTEVSFVRKTIKTLTSLSERGQFFDNVITKQ